MKYALVTGASRRIGAEIAKTLHHRGCNVFLHYHHSAGAASKLVEQMNSARKDSAHAVKADLGSTSDIEQLLAQLDGYTPKLDLLVNNASRFFPASAGNTSIRQWDELMDSNLRGPFFLTQALLPLLKAARGSIVNVLDVHASRPMRGHAVYCMAKAGLQMMTLALAKDLGPQIRVNAVAPGAILWPENNYSAEQQQNILKKIVMGRTGAATDVAAAVAYLGLDAPYVTGQVLAVDGGRSLNI